MTLTLSAATIDVSVSDLEQTPVGPPAPADVG